MYSNNDEYTNKPNINLPSIHTTIIDPSQYYISSNNLHSSYNNSLHDLTSLNPIITNNTPSPSNNTTIINPILCSNNNQELINDNNEEGQEYKRLKRMISNRESARRSRLRKRKQLDNLQHQVYQLLSANHQLAEKLSQVTESNYELIQENAQLRQNAIDLQKNVSDIIMATKGGMEEGGACNNHHNGVFIRASQTITSASFTKTSMDAFH